MALRQLCLSAEFCRSGSQTARRTVTSLNFTARNFNVQNLKHKIPPRKAPLRSVEFKEFNHERGSSIRRRISACRIKELLQRKGRAGYGERNFNAHLKLTAESARGGMNLANRNAQN